MSAECPINYGDCSHCNHSEGGECNYPDDEFKQLDDAK